MAKTRRISSRRTKKTNKLKKLNKSKRVHKKSRKGGFIAITPEERYALQKARRKFNLLQVGLMKHYIEYDAPPREVYDFMANFINVWNFAASKMGNSNVQMVEVREKLNNTYNACVHAVPQLHPGDDEMPEMRNKKSSQILSELFDYVSNIQDGSINNRQIIQLPEYESFTDLDEDISDDEDEMEVTDENSLKRVRTDENDENDVKRTRMDE